MVGPPVKQSPEDDDNCVCETKNQRTRGVERIEEIPNS